MIAGKERCAVERKSALICSLFEVSSCGNAWRPRRTTTTSDRILSLCFLFSLFHRSFVREIFLDRREMHHIDERYPLGSLSPFYPSQVRSKSRRPSQVPRRELNEMFQLGVERRRETRLLSPPALYQPTPTPDVFSVMDDASSFTSHSRVPGRISSTLFTLPGNDRVLNRNFPKQSFERRQANEERRREKHQQRQRLIDNDDEQWFHLRQSLAELKRLTTNEELLIDPTTTLFNCDGYSFEALKQAMEYSSLRSAPPSRTSVTSSSSVHPRTQTYLRPGYHPLMVAAKPLHVSTSSVRNPSRSSATLRGRSSSFKSPVPSGKAREQLVLSDLSIADDPPSPPPLDPVLPPSPIVPPRAPSSLSLRSTIKLQNQVPRCRSAASEVSPKFIIVTDPEHRIESWYHHYPFIAADDLREVFRSKDSGTTVQAYFLEPTPSASPPAKSYLQGKAFHSQLDWKKFDLILISDQVDGEIFAQLQAIVTLIRKSGPVIPIQQINHQQDLKSQIRAICRP